MNSITLTKTELRGLVILAAFGFIAPNGVFLYFFLHDPEMTKAALRNPISLVFITEAFVLMFLFAWLLGKAGIKKPSGLLFVAMSLIGSLGFSLPAALYLMFKGEKRE
ncbi:MAG: hypothetical protein PSW75_02945 [bacterium]|nr:hypothetical protein [bacterium]MDI1337596.1 hypothetical protein [Lacunisphaera sp.]